MTTRDNVFEAVRAAAFAKVAAVMSTAFAAVPVQYENRNLIDVEQQQLPWLSVELVWNDGEQATIEHEPITRYEGAIYLTVYTKRGNGTKLAQEVMGRLAREFKRMPSGTLFQTRAARPVPARTWEDWHLQTLRVPFYTDDAA